MDGNETAARPRLEAGDLLTVEELARVFRFTPSGVMRLKDREKLPHYRVGTRILFNRHEVALWLAARRMGEVSQ